MSWKNQLLEMLREDVGKGDVTTAAVFPHGINVRGTVVAQEAGIAAGVEESSWLFRNAGLRVQKAARDGQRVKKGGVLLEVEGSAQKVFEAERTALNLIGRMGGIAAETAKAVEISRKAGGRARIAATRKTVLKWFDKKAVVLGGGIPHRMGLYDAVLIKTSHVRLAGGVEKALALAMKGARGKKIEIEVSTPEEALAAAKKGADIVMLDNFSHSGIRRALGLIEGAGLRKKLAIEISGGINLKNLKKFARHGADWISMGCLTHSPKWMQVGMRVSRA